jgi:ParB family chromosome partitioning protein
MTKDTGKDQRKISDIPVGLIDIINPRERNQKTFKEMIASIKALGLKKPITVTPRHDGNVERYALVCGQGRLEAFMALGQSTIPAMVIEASDEDALIISLVENIARRQPRPMDILQGIRILKERGYDNQTISKKTALDISYINGILQLLDKGESRLIAAVESGRIPLTAAVEIARAHNESEVQAILQAAYESGELRGHRLIAVRRLIEQRRTIGRSPSSRSNTTLKYPRMSSASLVRAYNQEVDRQRNLIRKADLVQQRLAFVAAAMGSLLSDEHFINLLRAEGLDTLPKPLDERIRLTGALS